MTILWSFSYNSFVKFYLKNGSHNTTVLYPNLCYNKVCCIETTLYCIFQTVHSDSATMKMVFPSTSQAMGMVIPIYKLHITNTIPTSALCDSIVYGMVRTAIKQLFHACL